MATLSNNFKVFYFPKESGFKQFYSDHPEIKQTRALILETKDNDHFVLSNDTEFTNLVYGKIPNEPSEITLHQVCVNKVAPNLDPELAYHSVHFTYRDTPDKSYFIAGHRYQIGATNKNILSETLSENIQKVLNFTYGNNDRIMKEIMGHF